MIVGIILRVVESPRATPVSIGDEAVSIQVNELLVLRRYSRAATVIQHHGAAIVQQAGDGRHGPRHEGKAQARRHVVKVPGDGFVRLGAREDDLVVYVGARVERSL